MRNSGLILGFGILTACGQPQEAKDTKTTPKTAPNASARRVEVAKLSPSQPRLDIVLPGEVEGSKEALLAAALGGYVERVSNSTGTMITIRVSTIFSPLCLQRSARIYARNVQRRRTD